MKEVLPELEAWSERGEPIALATVIAVRRSAPRPPGAKMAVSRRGEIDVWVQAYDSGPPTPALQAASRSDARLAEVTLLEGARPGAKLVVDPDGGRQGTLGSPELDDDAARLATGLMWKEQSERRGPLFVDVVAPPSRLILFGAVDITAAVCRLARAAGWRPYVADPRARFATPERFPEAVEVIVAWPEEAFARLGGIDQATSIAVLTHDPKLDDAALAIALRSPARFVGAMGSRRAQASRRERLLEAALGEPELNRLAAPLGLDLGAVDREETALAILSEIVAARHGRHGGGLAHASGRIHDVGQVAETAAER